MKHTVVKCLPYDNKWIIVQESSDYAENEIYNLRIFILNNPDMVFIGKKKTKLIYWTDNLENEFLNEWK